MNLVSIDGLRDTDVVGDIEDNIIPAKKRLEIELETMANETQMIFNVWWGYVSKNSL